MKIERYLVNTKTIEEFAEENDLTMVITERDMPMELGRYYAAFKNAEVKDGVLLRSEYGDGDSERAAIERYAATISGRTLVLNAYTDDRRTIRVPRLTASHLVTSSRVSPRTPR